MKRSRDPLWLLSVVVLVAVAVAYTPYEVPIPRRLAQSTPTPTPNYLRMVPTCPTADTYTSAIQPETVTFHCTGSRHAKAYTGFQNSSAGFPQYSAESGLLDHP